MNAARTLIVTAAVATSLAAAPAAAHAQGHCPAVARHMFGFKQAIDAYADRLRADKRDYFTRTVAEVYYATGHYGVVSATPKHC